MLAVGTKAIVVYTQAKQYKNNNKSWLLEWKVCPACSLCIKVKCSTCINMIKQNKAGIVTIPRKVSINGIKKEKKE